MESPSEHLHALRRIEARLCAGVRDPRLCEAVSATVQQFDAALGALGQDRRTDIVGHLERGLKALRPPRLEHEVQGTWKRLHKFLERHKEDVRELEIDTLEAAAACALAIVSPWLVLIPGLVLVQARMLAARHKGMQYRESRALEGGSGVTSGALLHLGLDVLPASLIVFKFLAGVLVNYALVHKIIAEKVLDPRFGGTPRSDATVAGAANTCPIGRGVFAELRRP